MIDISKMMITAMKKEMFPGHDELNIAARQILGEMKTKIKDIKGEITNEIQYKMLQKMKKDRENSVKIYTEAFEKTGSNVAKENLKKAQNELEPIDLFLFELESEMPKKMNEIELTGFIKNLINTITEANGNVNKGSLMKLLKYRSDIDMAMAAKIISNLGI